MSNLRELLKEAREWIGDGEKSDGLHRDHWTPEYASIVDRIDAALAEPDEVERLRVDAERYRWLRTWVKRDVDTQAVVPMTGTFQATALSLDELDAAIDTAMLTAAPEGK